METVNLTKKRKLITGPEWFIKYDCYGKKITYQNKRGLRNFKL